ncbi:hypothetical protein HZ992_04485 [Rhizobacter sp. AJA081-3]|uniref:capsular polysaccharide export protein, LipB/KpsS family n=1 Tax=Rhizobacter sp. AJA081-3 TaxID=2753607 RepID=UPI001AE01539|nr:hypothetical protein [Rhizobacter sp. AJA081-3]QTN24262.1 hypothetical protein HZ992_04485 [Rhizobacter sp. AJA081-3]
MREMMERLARRLWWDRLPATWLRDTRRMRRFVDEIEPTPPRHDGLAFGIVLAPWCGSAVPWFSLVVGLLLLARGHRVSLIVDNMPFGEPSRGWRFQLACIRAVLRRLRGRHAIVTLSNHAHGGPVLDDAARRSIERLATLNVVWAQRGESTMPTGDVELLRRQLTASRGAIAGVMAAQRFDVLFVPGGVWGSSGLWVELARAAGVRVASYDSGGYGMLLLAADGIACQLRDIPRAYALLQARCAGSAQERAFVVESARAEIEKRRAGTDKFASQVQGARPKDPRFAGGVLLALNSPWDSAALGLHTVYSSTQKWIVETVRYLLEHTEAPVIVRQHPVERLEIARSSDDYRAMLVQHFGAHPRLHFVAAEDPVNSYDLLEQVATVVVYTSTIGTEAAAHGKPVVTESSSYYAELGFVRQATTETAYREHLSDAVAGRSQVTPAMRDDALACYYLTQCCNWVYTPLNVPGFPEWSQRRFVDLAGEPSVRNVVRSLEENVPVAFLNHLARLEPPPCGT